MRPKKKILLVDSDPETLSIRSFMLCTRGYAVTSTDGPAAAAKAILAQAFDMVVVALDRGDADSRRLVSLLKNSAPHTPVILTSQTVSAGFPHQAEAFLGKDCCSPAELWERIRILIQRKRGPRKQVKAAILIQEAVAA